MLAGGLVGGCRPPDDSPRGLFRQNCARCHGTDGRGNPRAVKAQPGLDLETSEMLREGDREAVRRLIVEGAGTMPAFGDKLTGEQIEALVALSFALAGREAPPPAAGDRSPSAPSPAGPGDAAGGAAASASDSSSPETASAASPEPPPPTSAAAPAATPTPTPTPTPTLSPPPTD